MSDLEREFEEYEANPASGEFSLLQRKLEEAAALKQKADELEDDLKEVKGKLHELRTKELPDMMLEAGVQGFVLRSGWSADMEDLIEGSWPKAPLAREEATKHLEQLDADDVLKTLIVLEYPKEAHDQAVKAFNQIRSIGLEPTIETTVHPQTLKALARDFIRNKVYFDPKKLGLHVCKIVKFTKGKR
jgi:hypothetical protein